ncbi:MAG: hypothetical protein AAF810_16865 [Cyanobacteria bacterium P01_D01_bin.36]
MRLVGSRLSLAMLSSLLLLIAVGSVSTAAPEAASPEEQGTNITRLVLRDYAIAISSGPNNIIRYDIYSQTGEILDAQLTSAQLQASYPAIYDSLQPAVAGADSDFPVMMMLMDSSTLQP